MNRPDIVIIVRLAVGQNISTRPPYEWKKNGHEKRGSL